MSRHDTWRPQRPPRRGTASAGASMCCVFICIRHLPEPRKARLKAEALLSNIAYLHEEIHTYTHACAHAQAPAHPHAPMHTALVENIRPPPNTVHLHAPFPRSSLPRGTPLSTAESCWDITIVPPTALAIWGFSIIPPTALAIGGPR
jgi:hypothetical protein